jgi:hypothetical protein
MCRNALHAPGAREPREGGGGESMAAGDTGPGEGAGLQDGAAG